MADLRFWKWICLVYFSNVLWKQCFIYYLQKKSKSDLQVTEFLENTKAAYIKCMKYLQKLYSSENSLLNAWQPLIQLQEDEPHNFTD